MEHPALSITHQPARSSARLGGGKNAEAVARAIVSGLFTGQFSPGQRLIEPDLVATFSVSRSTVREALTQLTSQGVVVSSPYKGAAIHRLSRKEAVEILDMLEVLIGFACRRAAASSGLKDEADVLRTSLSEIMPYENHGHGPAFQAARSRFFRALIALAGNGKLRDTLRGLNIHLLRVQMHQYDVEGHRERFEDYRAMTECILAGDADAAEQAGRHYISRVAEAIGRIPDKLFAP